MATGVLPVLAPQEFVDCIPNPNQCGGTGGCAGSTEEYGFAYAMLYGVAAESSYPYTATTGKSCLLNQGGRVPVAGVSNFVKLPANDAVALMQVRQLRHFFGTISHAFLSAKPLPRTRRMKCST